MKSLLTPLAAALIALPLVSVPTAADAAPRHQRTAPVAAMPHVDGFDVEQVRQLAPGTDLVFKLYGTPGATATLAIAGSQRTLPLQETQLGIYEGIYTVSTRDRLAPDSTVTANLRLGNHVATAVLDEPLLAGTAPSGQPGAAGPARIDSFEMGPAPALTGGNDLTFSARGTPGGQASVSIPGARKVFLQETRPGHYSGSYTIRNGDRIDTQAPVVARLTAGGQTAMTTLGRPLSGVAMTATTSTMQPHPPSHPQPHVAPPPHARPQSLAQNDNWTPAPRSAPAVCGNCATVVAVNPVQVRGAGSYVGPVAGGVVGALLGSQIGGGNGRTLGGVAGAVGGALAGREIEQRVNRATHYEVVARLQSGGQQTFSYASDPGLSVGTRVRIEGDHLVRER